MIENVFDIEFEKVTDLHPKEMGVIYLTGNPKKVVDMYKVDTIQEFNRYKFELTAWLKKKKNPNERVLFYEITTDGMWDIEKETRLVEARKTREEKAQELKEENDIREAFSKAYPGVKYGH